MLPPKPAKSDPLLPAVVAGGVAAAVVDDVVLAVLLVAVGAPKSGAGDDVDVVLPIPPNNDFGGAVVVELGVEEEVV